MSRLAGILICALQASAFLLPPNIAQVSDDKHATEISLMGSLSSDSAVLQLPCSECAFSGAQSTEKIEESEDEPLFWIQGGAKSLLVNFTISEDGQRLKVNGETIYPLELMEANIYGSTKVYADQVRSGASLAEIEDGTEKSTRLDVTGHAVSVRQHGEDLLVPVEFQIFEVEGQPVDLASVIVKILDMGDRLAIVNVHVDSPEPHGSFGLPPKDMPAFLLPAPRPEDLEESEIDRPEFGPLKECSMLPAALCKLRNIFEAKIMGMGKKGGCPGRKGGRPHDGKLPTHIRPHFHSDADEHDKPRPHHGHFFHPEMDENEPPRHPHGRPHHMRPHHHGHHRHHFMHAFTRGLAAVLIPTMAGVAVGMAVSIVGLVFGRLIGFLWIKLYRGGRRGYASVALDESAEEMDTEKVVVDEEPLPVYELAPAYEDIVKETK